MVSQTDYRHFLSAPSACFLSHPNPAQCSTVEHEAEIHVITVCIISPCMHIGPVNNHRNPLGVCRGGGGTEQCMFLDFLNTRMRKIIHLHLHESYYCHHPLVTELFHSSSYWYLVKGRWCGNTHSQHRNNWFFKKLTSCLNMNADAEDVTLNKGSKYVAQRETQNKTIKWLQKKPKYVNISSLL